MSNGSQALAILGQNDLAKGGIGLGSKLFQLKPSTITLVQNTTKLENKVPGKLRVSDTGQLFDEMQVVMLFEPVQQRAYYEGQEFNKDSKVCFSNDCISPHPMAKDKKAYYCKGCPMGSWDKYRETHLRADLPKCKEYWRLTLADRVTKLPYYLNVQGTSIRPFEQAMGLVAKIIALMKARGETPNIFDVSFIIFAVPQDKGTYYSLGFKNIAPLKVEDRAQFGDIFLDFANRKSQGSVVDSEEEEVAETNATVDVAVAEAPPVSVAGEIVI